MKTILQYNYRGRSPDKRNSRSFSQVDIVDQTVRRIIIETIFQDQTQTEVTTQIITEIIPTQKILI